jgi:hypothetical protein
MFISAACCCMLNVLSNVCLFKLFPGGTVDYWLQLLNVFFSIGGLIGPLIVIYYQHVAMAAIGVLMMFTIIPLFFLHSP